MQTYLKYAQDALLHVSDSFGTLFTYNKTATLIVFAVGVIVGKIL